MDTAAIAEIRFGLGRTPGAAIGDPRRWLALQLTAPDAGPPATPAREAFLALREDADARRARNAAAPASTPGPNPVPEPQQPSRARDLFRADAQALMVHAIATPLPFRERLVWFWANHFTVSIRHGRVAPLAAAFVQDAIRPYVTGRFSDMLLAVMRHPAMLIYLDNAASAGPNSVVGARANRGLNENLARECLELHTVSPAARYTQADVTEFARILTGWSIDGQNEPFGYRFRPGIAEPGDKTMLGRRFPEGEYGGVLVLQFLGTHPATCRHLATKLVQHFVDDLPPADAVRRIEAVLHDTGGDLGAASLELTRLPAAWQPLTKLRSPQELAIATFRAAATPPERRPNFLAVLNALGQPLFNAPLPNGWPDQASEWTGPEALLRRVDWAYAFASRPELPEPMQMAETALGPLLSDSTATEIRRAGSRRDAITLLISSPEFQRR